MPPIPSAAPATSIVGTRSRSAASSNLERANWKSPTVGASATTALVAPGQTASSASAAYVEAAPALNPANATRDGSVRRDNKRSI